LIWRALAALCVLALVGACANAPQPSRDAFWQGRMSLTVHQTPVQHVAAAFELEGNATQGVLTLFSPLGYASLVLRWSPGLAEWLQNDLWKPLTLLNPGYLVRNLMDGQFHVALSGDRNLSGMFNNPLAFFSWVMGNRGVEDITGLNFKQQEGWFDAVARNTARWTGDPTNAAEKVITTGDYVNVSRLQHTEAHT
jgi:hypothetical protein